MSSSDDEVQSVASSKSSKSEMKTPCPYCNKDFQLRTLFNHTLTKHARDFMTHLTPKMRKMSPKDYSQPLEVIYEWKDDQDEEQERTVYACMGSNKIFLNPGGCITHWKKHAKDAKKHIAEMTKLRKDIDSMRPVNHWAVAQQTNDPALAKAIYRWFLYMEPRVPKLIYLINKERKYHTPEDVVNDRNYKYPDDLIDSIKNNHSTIQKLITLKIADVSVAVSCYYRYLQYLECIHKHYQNGTYASPQHPGNTDGYKWLCHPEEPPYYGVCDDDSPELGW